MSSDKQASEAATSPQTGRKAAAASPGAKEEVRRNLFAEDEQLFTLPAKTQAACDEWVRNIANGIIKCRGTGRSVEVVHEEIRLFTLGATLATAGATEALHALLAKPEEQIASVAALLTAPEAQQDALDEWVKAQLGESLEARDGLLKLRGDGRTAEVVASEVELVIGGARHQLTQHQLAQASPATDSPPAGLIELPEKTQSACDAWVEAHGAKGIIKCRGTGRSVEVVHEEILLWRLGMMQLVQNISEAADPLLTKPEEIASVAALLTAPEAQQDALDTWVKAQLGESLEARDGLLKLRGEGRTAEVVAGEVERVIAGAKVGCKMYALPHRHRAQE